MSGTGKPPKILFICEGNIMRSQMAEAFYNSLTGTRDATSAGSGTWPGRPIDPAVAEAMREEGIDTDGRQSTVLTREMFDSADRVVWFPTPYMPDYVKQSDKSELWDIADPWYQPDDGTDYVRSARDEIKSHVAALIGENL